MDWTSGGPLPAGVGCPRTLHLLALLGGWPGAILGQRQFRHKTRKVAFLIVFWAVAVLHVAVVGAMAHTLIGPPQIEAFENHRPISQE